MGDQRSGGIAWTDHTWNPVRGCMVVSAGCTNCYAMKQAHRFSGPGEPYDGLTRLGAKGAVWTGQVTMLKDKLMEPLRWKRGRRVFVNSMSDLFYEEIPDEFIDRVFAAMWMAPAQTFQVLTKRADRMREYMNTPGRRLEIVEASHSLAFDAMTLRHPHGLGRCPDGFDVVLDSDPLSFKHAPMPWPLPNVWLLVSTEDQYTADDRIPQLLATPAAIRGISAEPLIGPIKLETLGRHWLGSASQSAGMNQGLDWVVIGGESGTHARRCDAGWIRSLIDECLLHEVAVFVKQLGARPFAPDDVSLKWPVSPGGASAGFRRVDGGYEIRLLNDRGKDPSEWPTDLKFFEFPKESR